MEIYSVCNSVDADASSHANTGTAIDLEQHVPALCLALGGKIALHAKRQSAQKLGLDLCEWRILQVLGAKGRTTIIDIADCIAMDRGGTSRAIAHMEKNNYIVREADSSDRRRSFVKLSQQGFELHKQIARFALAREERLLQKLSADDRVRLRELLVTLTTEAGLMVEEQWTPVEVKL